MGGNVEIVRRSFEAWNRDDWVALQRFYDPAVVGKAPEGWPETGLIEGWEAVRAQFARNKDSWEEERVEIDELLEPKPGLVLARVRWLTRGKTSEIPFESPVTIFFKLLEGRIVRLEYYFDHGEAQPCVFDAAGNTIARASAPPGGNCITRPCWSQDGSAFTYRSRDRGFGSGPRSSLLKTRTVNNASGPRPNRRLVALEVPVPLTRAMSRSRVAVPLATIIFSSVPDSPRGPAAVPCSRELRTMPVAIHTPNTAKNIRNRPPGDFLFIIVLLSILILLS